MGENRLKLIQNEIKRRRDFHREVPPLSPVPPGPSPPPPNRPRDDPKLFMMRKMQFPHKIQRTLAWQKTAVRSEIFESHFLSTVAHGMRMLRAPNERKHRNCLRGDALVENSREDRGIRKKINAGTWKNSFWRRRKKPGQQRTLRQGGINRRNLPAAGTEAEGSDMGHLWGWIRPAEEELTPEKDILQQLWRHIFSENYIFCGKLFFKKLRATVEF